MKKLCALLLVAVMSLSLVACGNKEENKVEDIEVNALTLLEIRLREDVLMSINNAI